MSPARPTLARPRKAAAIAERHVLVFNGGSSSMKFGLFRPGGIDAGGDPRVTLLASGEIAGIGAGVRARFSARCGVRTRVLEQQHRVATPVDAVRRIIRLLDDGELPPPDAIGHRVVHGGPNLDQHCRIDPESRALIEAAAGLAPLHMPALLPCIDHLAERFPACPQFACFDTRFHAAMPELARRLPLSRALHKAGVRRYGFHGLSCESILRQFGEPLPPRVIVAHLGSGSSVTAIRAGQSVDTSMGMTPGGGLPMATRSGDLDPGVLLHLMRDPAWSRERIEALVERESGLLGLSGLSGDLRRLHAASPDNAAVRLAIAIYCMAVAKAIAGMATVLEGFDLLIFTGGIGENDARVRSMICTQLRWFGVLLYEPRNAIAVNPISGSGSRVRVLAMPSQEERQIALHVATLMDR
jgi:acetate kinase